MNVVLSKEETSKLFDTVPCQIIESNGIYFTLFDNSQRIPITEDNKIKVLKFLRDKSIKAILSK